MRPSVLAERLHIAARSATEVVDALEARGLVERAPDPDDRRATLVRPTEAARSELAEVDRVRREQSERFLAVLSRARPARPWTGSCGCWSTSRRVVARAAL